MRVFCIIMKHGEDDQRTSREVQIKLFGVARVDQLN